MKIKIPKQIFPIVEILWEDIFGQDTGWIKPGHNEIESCIISSVGYLVVDTKDYIVYASDLDKDGETNGRTQIPKVNIKHIKVLRKAKNEISSISN